MFNFVCQGWFLQLKCLTLSVGNTFSRWNVQFCLSGMLFTVEMFNFVCQERFFKMKFSTLSIRNAFWSFNNLLCVSKNSFQSQTSNSVSLECFSSSNRSVSNTISSSNIKLCCCDSFFKFKHSNLSVRNVISSSNDPLCFFEFACQTLFDRKYFPCSSIQLCLSGFGHFWETFWIVLALLLIIFNGASF